MTSPAFQDSFAHIHCFGCGRDNPGGLGIKSHWLQEGASSICGFEPAAHHCAGPISCVNGGIIATVIDCHAICTAMATAYLEEGRSLDSLPPVQFATASLQVRYLRPARMGQLLLARADVVAVEGKKTLLKVEVTSGGEPCATAEVVAVRVPADWQP